MSRGWLVSYSGKRKLAINLQDVYWGEVLFKSTYWKSDRIGRGKLNQNKLTMKVAAPGFWVWDGLAELGKGTCVHMYSPVTGYRLSLNGA